MRLSERAALLSQLTGQHIGEDTVERLWLSPSEMKVVGQIVASEPYRAAHDLPSGLDRLFPRGRNVGKLEPYGIFPELSAGAEIEKERRHNAHNKPGAPAGSVRLPTVTGNYLGDGAGWNVGVSSYQRG